MESWVYRRRRWFVVFAAVLLVGSVEALSDTVFDAFLPFPFHTLLVLAVVTAVVGTGAWFAFRRIDLLNRDLRERNAALESRNAVLRAVYDLSLAVSGQADPDQTIASIVDHARSLLGVDAALLALDGPSGELRLRAASAVPGVLVGDEPALVGVMAQAEDDLDCYLRPGYQIRLSAPVSHGEKRVGALGLATAKGIRRHFDVSEVETLSALATQVGLALEAARLQSELQVLAIQRERERIAREMHDGLAQVLAYVSTKSQAVEEMLAHGRMAEARQQLAELAAAARSVYVDVREAILNLSTPGPRDRGVAAALEEYAAMYAESSKLAVRFKADTAAARAPLSAEAQAEVFSIAREALTNVRKHARAHRVTLELALEGRELVLRIGDDGVGFDAELLAIGPERWPHFGLAGMRERAESVGGGITWRSTAGAGTQVELRVPIGGAPLSTPSDDVVPSQETRRPAAQHQAGRSSAATVSEAD
ncbi:MAG: GAF domain-containing sensor histidine kinase [Candidatus Limnocylindrales bacterium]|jgi:two-component system nitrate/nitrite sensor histidine kinase NarX